MDNPTFTGEAGTSPSLGQQQELKIYIFLQS
jgi:hypothetical protein